MIVFTLKMLKNFRKAVAGRKYPHQLAGAVALGFLCGIIPHGNLLAVVLVFFALCCNINHAMATLVGIGITLVATKLDPYSHIVGQFVLSNQNVQPLMTKAWMMPFVPWTDLNNTIVMGSFLIGVTGTLPVFLLTLPVFKFFKPKELDPKSEEAIAAAKTTAERSNTKATGGKKKQAGHDSETTSPQPAIATSALAPIPFEPLDNTGDPSAETDPSRHSVRLVHQAHAEALPPRFASREPGSSNATSRVSDLAAQDSALAAIPFDILHSDGATSADDDEKMVSVDTRIDIIRVNENNNDADATKTTHSDTPAQAVQPVQPMDEALNYLLRQLRNSQQRKAAG
ncbi:TIGR03546 family protein [Stieleria varia]|uniref:DUF2062 domain-containing protein n=1 Tax=Stieleria varia TaxID=2528005 RepID=A0A5C6AMM9_9BACT|nr:TIGR03546 family protein [Stieleria varia]TWU01313.1 hypothetical protein Pla52n_46870 [Stieleria varia]